MPEPIQHQGKPVSVVAFYSTQGGVGKSTIARKFAELVTRATGSDGDHPNVLLVDLDVEAQGVTYRIMGSIAVGGGTVHEAIAAQDANVATAHNVTANVSIVAADTPRRGQLYLLPAAPPGATRLFDVIANTKRDVIMQVLHGTIERLVEMYGISCVIIDCAPGATPYSAAAATIADVPVLIGRNESATFEQIQVQADRFKELYEDFQPAKQSVVINQVSVREYYEERAKLYAVADWIPLTGEVIHETEGLRSRKSLTMLLFENYIIDLIKKFLIGKESLIPESHEVLPKEWLNMLAVIRRIDDAPKMRRLRLFARLLLPLGVIAVAFGIAGVLLDDLESLARYSGIMKTAGTILIAAGALFLVASVYFIAERGRIERSAREIAEVGADGVFQRLRSGASHRRGLEEIRRICEKISVSEKDLQGEAT